MKKSIVLLAGLMTAALSVPAATALANDTATAPEAADIAINEKNFPDEIFRSYVQLNFDTDCNEKLSPAEIDAVLEIDVAGFGLTSLKGIEYFKSIGTLDCSCNELTSLDLSNNKYLYDVECFSNKLTTLSVKNCKDLEYLSCDQNYLKTLDVSGNTKLVTLTCSVNDLSELKISNNKELKNLYCGNLDYIHSDSEWDTSTNLNPRQPNNHIKSLDLSNNKGLVSFNCCGNQLTQLNLDNCQELKELNCNDNKIQKLSLSKTYALYYFECARNEIAELDLKDCKKLYILWCEYNKLSKLDVRNQSELSWLIANNNQIEELDLGKIKKLQNLGLATNKLTKLNVSYLMNLEDLGIGGNNISKIDVSACTKLEYLSVGSNPIEKLDLTKNTKLRYIEATECKLKTIDLSKNTKLEYAYLWQNKLTSVDLPKLGELRQIRVEENALTQLDITSCLKLISVSASSNKLSKMDFSQNPELQRVFMDDNQFTQLDLSACTKLEYLVAERNKLTSVKLPAKATEFRLLNVAYNELRKLDVSGAPNLEILHVYNNKIGELNLANNKKLNSLLLHENELRNLDISMCKDIVDALNKYGVEKKDGFNYYYCTAKVDGVEHEYFTLDTKVALKGYKLPEPPTSEDPSFEDFVERLYTVALGRASEPEGKEFWVKQVVEEGKTGADCARFFLLDADEFMKRGLSVDEFVETLYATFFDRESDAAGKKGWVDAISSGAKTRAEVVNDFIESTEWCDVCATYGVKSGARYHKATKPSKNAINFATRLYTCCLKRDAEEGGLQYWALALTNLEKTGAEAAQFFFESDEFIGYKTSDKEYLLRLYTTFMDRDPAADEIDYWLGEIAGGRQTRHSILAFFAQSKEFTGICKQYGIERGTIE